MVCQSPKLNGRIWLGWADPPADSELAKKQQIVQGMDGVKMEGNMLAEVLAEFRFLGLGAWAVGRRCEACAATQAQGPGAVGQGIGW